MNNFRKQIQIAYFAISLFVFLDLKNAQQISYQYGNNNFGVESDGVRGNGGRIASVTSTLFQSTVNQNNDYGNSANQRRPTNELSSGIGVYQPSNQGALNSEYASSKPSQPITDNYSNNDFSTGYQNNIEQLNGNKPNRQVQGGGSIFSMANNALSRTSQVQQQNTWTNGASNSNRPMLQSNDRNSVYNNNKNNIGISSFQNTGQGNQRRPVLQDSSESSYQSSSNSFQSQRDKNYDNNHNSGTNFQSNGNELSNQGKPTNYQFNPSNNGYEGTTSQRKTTRSPQFLERDTVMTNNGFSNNNYHQSNNQQWSTKPTTNKGSGSTLGIIASNDGYVQSRPSQDLEKNANTNFDIKNHDYEANDYEANNKNFQSGHSERPINLVQETNQNNHQNNGNQFFNSENVEDFYESKPAPAFNRQNNNNGNNGNSKNNNNSNANKNNNNGNGHSNSNGNNRNESGEKHSNSKANNKHSQITSAGHQGNKSVKKPNLIGLINSNKNKNSNSNENGRKMKTNIGGNIKKRVSQIKYEQYLTSIFPDLDNEDVQEVKDFQGRKLARPGQFPHMGAIGFKNHILNKTEYKCGASLISDIWAITTAHCTKYNELKPTYVRFGDLNLKAAEEDIDPQTRKISMIVNHPSYNENSLYNDIALLQLNKVLIFTEFVQPIRIWYRDEIPFTMAYAMGFGAVQFAGAQTNRLTQLDLTIVPNDVCARQMPKQSNAPQGIISSQICAIDNKETESDTFQGDSGGPLEISFYAEEGRRQRQYLIGMTSFGVVGTTRLPGVYTRVSSYVDWIEKTVWSSEYDAFQ